jgi:hypothetical protein
VRPGGRILDIECGSERDVAACSEQGCAVAIDAFKQVAEMGAKWTGPNIIGFLVQDSEPDGASHGIWASASLLH